MHNFDLEIRRRLNEILEELEGDLVPTCTCGWPGLAETGTTPGLRSSDGGSIAEEIESHRGSVHVDVRPADPSRQ